MTRLERRTKKMAEKMIGQWICVSFSNFTPIRIYKAIGYIKNGMALKISPLGNDYVIECKTRRMKLATEKQIAKAIAIRMTV